MANKVSTKFGTAGSVVAVYVTGTTTPAVLFSDAAETQPLSNPVTVTPNGFVLFHVAPGTYDLVESGSGTAKRTIAVAQGLKDGDLLVYDAATNFVRKITPAAAITSPTGGLTADTQARAAIDEIRNTLTNAGITL